MMYKSPIDVICGNLRTVFEDAVMRGVQDVGVQVDKEELVKALAYDRRQYDKGYADGKTDAERELTLTRQFIHEHGLEFQLTAWLMRRDDL